MTDIVLKNISKSWGDNQALGNVNFTCDAGSLLVLLGPSGCGKSTTLRLISGLETPTTGTVEIGGKDVTRLPPVKRNIAMVFQNYALFPHLSVAENILFGLKARKVSRAEQQKRLKEAAALLGLSTLLDRKPAQLSGGQRQRVALGRSIVAQVQVCLMDEPLSNLDAKLRQEMRQEIRSLQQRLGMTMIYVTHDQVEAMTLADRIILMKDGGIEQHGSPEALYNEPATAFTAGFIGNPPMNILGPVPGAESLPANTLMGIRPENIRLSGDKGLEARVTAIEYLGADSLVSCTIPGRDGKGQSLIAAVKGKTGLTGGDTVRLDWSGNDLHFFDAGDGHRLPAPGKGGE
ncbi:MAG: ABC transporter ATP-binding protein [Desulfobacter sp.]|nr:MAG: ABC transporter ATP-binding protein [Desulfobacter sp.]